MAKRARAGDTKKAVAYLRISTDTERQALGVEAQRQAIVSWAEREGVEVVAWFIEEASGGAPLDKRPVLLEALGTVATLGAGLLAVHRLDRFSRELLTAALAEAELRRHGATLACADGAGSGEDPTAELVRGILLSVARFEKAMIRARITSALAVKRARGEMTGAPPFGFRVGVDGKTLEPDEREGVVLEQIRALRASGLTVRGVQAAAAESGLVGRAGRPFTLSAVHAMLKRAA